jgi:hypothetical protein
MRFKNWLQNEMGPGGNATMDNPERDMSAMRQADAKLGVGAFKDIKQGENPPQTGVGMNQIYLDPRHRRRAMKKKMKK